MKSIILIIFIFLSVGISAQTKTFLFAKTVDAKTKKSVGLVDILCFRNDSFFVGTITDLEGVARIENEFKFNNNSKYRLIVSAIGYQRQEIQLKNEVDYPITILLTKKKGNNLKTKYVDLSATHCVEPRIKESEKIRDSIKVE